MAADTTGVSRPDLLHLRRARKVTQVQVCRPGHSRYKPLDAVTPLVDGAECECGATWRRGTGSRWATFSEWGMWHPAPRSAAA